MHSLSFVFHRPEARRRLPQISCHHEHPCVELTNATASQFGTFNLKINIHSARTLKELGEKILQALLHVIYTLNE